MSVEFNSVILSEAMILLIYEVQRNKGDRQFSLETRPVTLPTKLKIEVAKYVLDKIKVGQNKGTLDNGGGTLTHL